jgi:hypothetical protein
MDMNAVVDNSGHTLLMVQLATMPNSGLDISVEIVSIEQGTTRPVTRVGWVWHKWFLWARTGSMPGPHHVYYVEFDALTSV